MQPRREPLEVFAESHNGLGGGGSWRVALEVCRVIALVLVVWRFPPLPGLRCPRLGVRFCFCVSIVLAM